MNAHDVIWTAAELEGTVPLADVFADIAEPSRSWLRAWASTPRESCPHAGEDAVLWACGGLRGARCAACAFGSGLTELMRRCGRCTRPIDGDDDALFVVFPLPPNTIALTTLCHHCRTNEGTNP